nr:MAG TPA: hypothetical protein [Caudoviricetes sp.]
MKKRKLDLSFARFLTNGAKTTGTHQQEKRHGILFWNSYKQGIYFRSKKTAR